MDMLFKSGDISHRLNVSTPTVRRWVTRFSQFFSADAVASYRAHSLYTLDDFRVIATIQELSNMGYGLEAIERKLTEGYRFAGELADTPSSVVPASDHKKNPPLETVVDKLLQQNSQLMAELTETKYQLGILQGKLDMLLQKN